MPRTFKAVTLAFALILIAALPVMAAPEPAGFLGLDTGAGARAVGMGGAFVASADDVTASFWNPAGLGMMTSTGFSLTYGSLFNNFGLHYGLASVAVPFGNGNTIAIHGLGLWTSTYSTQDLVTGHPLLDGMLADSLTGVALSYGRKLGDHFLVGATAKGFWQTTTGVDSGQGYALDLGVQFRTPLEFSVAAETSENGTETQEVKKNYGNLAIGLKLPNVLGMHYLSGGTTERLWVQPVLGVAYESPDKKLLIESDMEFTFADKISVAWSTGAEIRVADWLTLRGGIDQSYLSLGAGASYQGFTLDYAMKMDGWQKPAIPDPEDPTQSIIPVDNVYSHVITLGYHF